jgi:hypothetical protein
MSFFAMPYYALTIVPKNGMNPLRILPAYGGCNSSRFSGPCNPVYFKGIWQKKTSPCSSDASLLGKRACNKKDTSMPMGLTAVTIWPSPMARNSIQRAKMVHSIELGRIG